MCIRDRYCVMFSQVMWANLQSTSVKFLQNAVCQKSLKSVNIWPSYYKNKNVIVFWDTVYVTLCCIVCLRWHWRELIVITSHHMSIIPCNYFIAFIMLIGISFLLYICLQLQLLTYAQSVFVTDQSTIVWSVNWPLTSRIVWSVNRVNVAVY